MRRSKTDQEGTAADVRYLKDAAAKAAGIPARLTAHSGRVGLTSELTARGASTAAVMRAGAWKTARMVARGRGRGRARHAVPGRTAEADWW